MTLESMVITAMFIALVVAGIAIWVLCEQLHQRNGYCDRMRREADDWRNKYTLERAKNRRP